MEPEEHQEEPDPKEDQIQVPTLRRSPRTRRGIIATREEFNQHVESLVLLLQHEELKQDLLHKEIHQEIPTVLEEAKEGAKTISKEDQGLRIIKGGEIIQPKIQVISFLPIMEGVHQGDLFMIGEDQDRQQGATSDANFDLLSSPHCKGESRLT